MAADSSAYASEEQMNFIYRNQAWILNCHADSVVLTALRNRSEKPYSLSHDAAKDVIDGIMAYRNLQHYIPDSRSIKSLSLEEAKSLADSYQGKITLEQQETLKSSGVKFNSNMSWREAENTILKLPMSEAQSSILESQGVVVNQPLNRQQAHDLIRMTSKVYQHSNVDKSVNDFLYKHAVKNNLVSDGQPYTVGKWQKDVYHCPPTEELLAKVKRYHLEDTVKAYIQNMPQVFSNQCFAVCQCVIDKHEKFLKDRWNAPCTEKQVALLKRNGIESVANAKEWGVVTPVSELSYAGAKTAICQELFRNRIIGVQNYNFLTHSRDIDLPNSVYDAAKDFKSMSDVEKKVLRDRLMDFIQSEKEDKRSIAVLSAAHLPKSGPLLPHEAVLKAAYDYKEKHGTLEGCEKDCAKALVVGNYTFSDRFMTNLQRKFSDIKVSVEHAYASIITDVLPQSVRNYPNCFNSNLQHVKTAFKALSNEMLKSNIRDEVKARAAAERSKNAVKGKGNEGLGG